MSECLASDSCNPPNADLNAPRGVIPAFKSGYGRELRRAVGTTKVDEWAAEAIGKLV